MNAATTMRIIEQTLATRWGTTTDIAWPNIPYTPPASASWLKVDVVWGNGVFATKDSWNRTTGILQLAIFAHVGSGDGTLLSLVEQARLIFNRQRLAAPYQSVMFGAASGPVMRFEESWRSAIVTTPFFVEEFAPRPPAIPGLLVWLNGDSFASQENAEKIARWPDLSGHGNDFLQPTVAQQPTIQKGIIGGHPVARFDGTNWLDGNPLAVSIPAGHSVIAVANRTGGGNATIWNGFPTALMGEAHFWSPPGTLIYQTEIATAGFAGAQATVPSLTNVWHVTHLHAPATGYCRFFLDEVEYTAGTLFGSMVSSVLTRVRIGEIGSYPTLSFPLVGDVAEFLVYDHVLTDTERGTTLAAYMGSRYGL